MTFNEKIDLFMKENNINDIKQFSNLVGVPYTTFRDIYKKKSAENSRFSTIKKLSEYMNCTLDYLAYDEISDKNEIKVNGIDINETDNLNETKKLKMKFSVKNKSKEDIDALLTYLNQSDIDYEITIGKDKHERIGN